ncbi:MAG: response regulator [Gemmataceae bacterium]
MTQVLIVDDHPAVEGLALRIGRQSNLEVCGEAADVGENASAPRRHPPDVAVVDLTLRSGDGLDLISG